MQPLLLLERNKRTKKKAPMLFIPSCFSFVPFFGGWSKPQSTKFGTLVRLEISSRTIHYYHRTVLYLSRFRECHSCIVSDLRRLPFDPRPI